MAKGEENRKPEARTGSLRPLRRVPRTLRRSLQMLRSLRPTPRKTHSPGPKVLRTVRRTIPTVWKNLPDRRRSLRNLRAITRSSRGAFRAFREAIFVRVDEGGTIFFRNRRGGSYAGATYAAIKKETGAALLRARAGRGECRQMASFLLFQVACAVPFISAFSARASRSRSGRTLVYARPLY